MLISFDYFINKKQIKKQIFLLELSFVHYFRYVHTLSSIIFLNWPSITLKKYTAYQAV